MQNRNYGIDLLRIVSTFMICILHTLGRGGILGGTNFISIQYETAWLIETLCLCAVNCYGLISGYVGYRAKYRYSSYLSLWLTVFFVSLFYTLIYAFWKPQFVTATTWIKLFFPVSTRQFWYFSAYTALFLLLPILNIAIDKLTKTQLKSIIIGIIILFSVLYTSFRNKAFFDTIWNSDNEPYGLLDGYSGLWLIVLYIIGAYFAKYGFSKKLTPKKGLLTYFVCCLFAWITRYFIDLIVGKGTDPLAYLYLASYVSPFILLAGIGLLAFFSKLNLNGGFTKVISFVSQSTFAIYLFQNHPLIWQDFMLGLVQDYANAPLFKMLGVVLLTAVCIFIVCLLLDQIRKLVFKALKIPKRLKNFEEKHLINIWDKQNSNL